MSAQTCPTCGAKPGMRCRPMTGSNWWIYPHVARITLEYGDWTAIFDEKYRDKTLRFQCRPYQA